MKFCEAMDKLKEGFKVTRMPWKEGVYFKFDDNKVKSYQPKLSNYIYDEDIMISDGWMIEGDDKEYRFCDIITKLQQGYKAKLKEWKESFIILDPIEKSLIIQSMDIFPFNPGFDSFVAEDWITIE